MLEHSVKRKSDNKNIALPKSDFAKNIVNKKDEFKNVSFVNFKPVFQLLTESVNIFGIINSFADKRKREDTKDIRMIIQVYGILNNGSVKYSKRRRFIYNYAIN